MANMTDYTLYNISTGKFLYSCRDTYFWFDYGTYPGTTLVETGSDLPIANNDYIESAPYYVDRLAYDLSKNYGITVQSNGEGWGFATIQTTETLNHVYEFIVSKMDNYRMVASEFGEVDYLDAHKLDSDMLLDYQSYLMEAP